MEIICRPYKIIVIICEPCMKITIYRSYIYDANTEVSEMDYSCMTSSLFFRVKCSMFFFFSKLSVRPHILYIILFLSIKKLFLVNHVLELYPYTKK